MFVKKLFLKYNYVSIYLNMHFKKLKNKDFYFNMLLQIQNY